MHNALHNSVLLASVAAQATSIAGIRAEITVLKGVLSRSRGPAPLACSSGAVDYKGGAFFPKQVQPIQERTLPIELSTSIFPQQETAI